MRFKVISFDVEGTIITHRFSEVIWEEAIPRLYSEKKGVSIDEAMLYVRGEYDKIGEERMEWYDIKYWFDYFELNDYRGLLKRYEHEISFYPEVHRVLEELNKHYTLVVSSNSPGEFLELEIEKVRGYFHRIFSAPSDFNQIKTADFYSTICGILGVEPSEMVHVGDHPVYDFLVPGKVGINSFYLDRKREKHNEFVVSDLKEFEIKLEELDKKDPECFR